MRFLLSALLSAAFLASAPLSVQAQSSAALSRTTHAPEPNVAGDDDGAPDTAVATAQPTPASTLKTDTVDATGEAENLDANGVAATVNDETISEYELRQRVALCVAIGGCLEAKTDKEKKLVHEQVLAGLVNEKIQLQEARKKHTTVSPPEVDKRIKVLLDENRITIQQLRATLEHAGSNEAALRGQITAQIAWQKTVQGEFVGSVNVTNTDVDQELMRIKEGANRPHYFLREIFLPVDNPEQNEKVRKQADDIDNQLANGASFQALAHQLSQSPSAAAGGDMGWVREGQLAPELEAAMLKMPVGTISKPIRAPGGFYILALLQRQEPAGTDVTPVNPNPVYPAGSLPLARLLMPLGENPSKELIANAMKVANDIRARVVSCAGMDKVAQQMKGSVYADLGVARLGDLSKQIQDAMANTGPGDTAAPFVDEAGIEIIGRCDKRPTILTAYTIPTRDEVEDQLFSEKISALARRYTRDLKRDADIQVR